MRKLNYVKLIPNTFEWQMNQDGRPYEAIDHTYDAMQISQYTANFFVQQSRKSSHKFSKQEIETASLIYNYRSFGTSGDFVEKYFFPNDFQSYQTNIAHATANAGVVGESEELN